MQKWPMTLKRYVIQNLDLYKRFLSKENIDTAMAFQFPKLGIYRNLQLYTFAPVLFSRILLFIMLEGNTIIHRQSLDRRK